MADILTPETLAFFLFLVVPGFVAMQTYDLIVPTEQRNFGESFVELITYSIFVWAVWFLPYLALVSNRGSLGEALYWILFVVGLVLVLLISPIVLATGYYKLLTSRRLRALLTRMLKKNIVDPTSTPWDFFFQEDRVVLVRFYLKTGEMFGGLYAKGSNASSFPQDQQIYVHKLYRLDAEGRFVQEVENTQGAIINQEDCKMIGFLRAEPAE